MLERLFRLSRHNTDPRTEIIAGITTFLTGAYIIFVHPNMLAATGMDQGALTTVTCLVAALSTLLIALWANAPLMMAPGMGLNAFFTYSLVLGQNIPWQTALGVVFLSGIFFLILTWLGFRQRMVHAIPQSLRLAASVGIGLFIAFIGMKNLGLIIKNDATLVSLGSFSPAVLLGLLGLTLAVLLEVKRIRGAIHRHTRHHNSRHAHRTIPPPRRTNRRTTLHRPHRLSAKHTRRPQNIPMGQHLLLHVRRFIR